MWDWDALADELDMAHRSGADEDIPEGSRTIELSDTLARQISAALRTRRPGISETIRIFEVGD